MDGGEKTMLLSPTNDLLCTQYKPPVSFSPAFSSFLHPSPDSRGKVRCSWISGTLGSQWLGFIVSSPITGLSREGAMLPDLQHSVARSWASSFLHPSPESRGKVRCSWISGTLGSHVASGWASSFLHPSPDSRGTVRCKWISGTLGSQWLGLIPFFTDCRTPEGRCDAPGSLALGSQWLGFIVSSPITGLLREGVTLLDLQNTR